MKITSKMKWDAIDNLESFLGNYGNNKNRNGASKEPDLEKAMNELIDNLHEFVKTGSRYDVANFIYGLSFLMRHSQYGEIQNEDKIGAQKSGCVYMINYALGDGNTISNRHPGLCMTVYGKKCFVIPMRSAFDERNKKMKKDFTEAYHPIENPNGEERNRQGLVKEGFNKDCILMVDDAKFVSVDAIEKNMGCINIDTFHLIEKHLLKVSMPWIWLQLRMYLTRCKEFESLVNNQTRKITILEEKIKELEDLLEVKKS